MRELIQELYENFYKRLLTEYAYSIKLRDATVSVCASLDEARERAQRFAETNPESIVTVVDASNGQTETWIRNVEPQVAL